MATGIDLVSGSLAAVPFGLIHADFRTETLMNNDGFVVSSNGLGGGNSYFEAVMHGVCEVIEGDAVALARASTLDRFPQIAWNSVKDEATLRFHEICRNHDVDVTLWDIATEIGVATFYCRLVEHGKGPSGVPIATDGAGCHPIPAIALRRALFEALQTRLLVISGARDDIRPRYYSSRAPISAGSGAEVPLLEGACINLPAHEMLDWLLKRLTMAGFPEAIVVDLTSRSPQLAFVRVIVPGLETFPHARGYNPGKRAQTARYR
jgi:ribosomal protein S12 methylthiotransferase accessory factor